jgi:hypothetical protein
LRAEDMARQAALMVAARRPLCGRILEGRRHFFPSPAQRGRVPERQRGRVGARPTAGIQRTPP